MKKQWMIGICVAVVCLIGATWMGSAQEQTDVDGLAPTSLMGERWPGTQGGGVPSERGEGRRQLTEEQQAWMEAARLEREEALEAFAAMLTEEQQALYEDMRPDPDQDGWPDESDMEARRNACQAFLDTLNEEQLRALAELCVPMGCGMCRPMGRPNGQFVPEGSEQAA